MNPIVKDPGHVYELPHLDGEGSQTLTFVKRHDPAHPKRFPGNSNSHPGTTLQAVIRAMLERVEYLQNQIPHKNNLGVQVRLLEILWLLEDRAAERHGYDFDFRVGDMDKMPMCPHCGHVVCPELGNVVARKAK